MARYVLAGDVGGTKADIALFVEEGHASESRHAKGLTIVREKTFRSRDFGGLSDVLHAFLAEGKERPETAAFGIPGPVVDEAVVTTNLPWRVEAGAVAKAIGAKRVRLMNDLEATAFGALFLSPHQLSTLQEGKARKGNIAVIAAGTGLGQAFLFWDGEKHLAAATEGGHAEFAPRDEREIELLRFLQKKHGRISWERVASGMGIANLWEFVTAIEKKTPGAAVRDRMAAGGDVGAVVGEAAVAGTDPLAVEVIDWFVSLYGAQAGNLALTVMSTGGVYVGGGIVGKLLPRVKAGGFVKSFRTKGRYESFMDDVPIRVILEPQCARLGAAEAARALLVEGSSG